MSRTVFLLLTILIIACQKGNDIPDPQQQLAPQITSINPTYTITTGSIVVINGENFGNDLASVIVKLDSVNIVPVSLSEQSLTLVIPGDILSEGSEQVALMVVVNGVKSNTIEITIQFALQGWKYINKDFSIDNNRVPTFMHFYNDEVGLIFGRDLLYSTNNGGASWGGIWSYGHLGEAFHVYNDTEAWIEDNYYDLLTFNYTNNTGTYARIDTITSIPALTQRKITGLFVTQPGHGYILTGDGSIFKVKGSFAPKDIELEYQYSKYTPSYGLGAATDYSQLKGLDEMNFMAIVRKKENDIVKPAIIHKYNGIYTEYDLAPLLGTVWPSELHYVDANTAFFLSADLWLYKLDFSKMQWVKMNASGFSTVCFLDANIGYAATLNIYGSDYEYIYKTTDGGITWNMDFALDRYHRVQAMCAKNGKVWAFGSGISGQFMVKYTPLSLF